MNDPLLIVIAYTFQQGRTFCERQGINERKAKLVATDSPWRLGQGRHLTNQDAIVRYGPWTEGKHVAEAMDVIRSMVVGEPFDYYAFMYDEVIPWPRHILERYSLR